MFLRLPNHIRLDSPIKTYKVDRKTVQSDFLAVFFYQKECERDG